MLRTVTLFSILCISISCSQTQTRKFDGFQKASKPGYSLLYLIRPCNLNLGIYSFDGTVNIFEGHFTKNKKNPGRDFSLDPCEYSELEVPQGFVEVKMNRFGNHSTILFAKNDQHFVSLYQSAPNALTIPEVFPEEIGIKKAAFHLTEYQGMTFKPLSAD